jgi:hypothetical protein
MIPGNLILCIFIFIVLFNPRLNYRFYVTQAVIAEICDRSSSAGKTGLSTSTANLSVVRDRVWMADFSLTEYALRNLSERDL